MSKSNGDAFLLRLERRRLQRESFDPELLKTEGLSRTLGAAEWVNLKKANLEMPGLRGSDPFFRCPF